MPPLGEGLGHVTARSLELAPWRVGTLESAGQEVWAHARRGLSYLDADPRHRLTFYVTPGRWAALSEPPFALWRQWWQPPERGTQRGT